MLFVHLLHLPVPHKEDERQQIDRRHLLFLRAFLPWLIELIVQQELNLVLLRSLIQMFSRKDVFLDIFLRNQPSGESLPEDQC